MQEMPNLIHRRCGGWLAVSPRSEPIKIGVTADTRDDAICMFIASLERWRLIKADAASTRTNDLTSE